MSVRGHAVFVRDVWCMVHVPLEPHRCTLVSPSTRFKHSWLRTAVQEAAVQESQGICTLGCTSGLGSSMLEGPPGWDFSNTPPPPGILLIKSLLSQKAPRLLQLIILAFHYTFIGQTYQQAACTYVCILACNRTWAHTSCIHLKATMAGQAACTEWCTLP